MMRTRVKICGITRLEDARLAVSLGADALGFVFVPASARHVSVAAARGHRPTAAAVSSRASGCSSMHRARRSSGRSTRYRGSSRSSTGARRRRTATRFGRGYLKALGVAEALPTAKALAAYERAEGFLLDSNVPGELGGTGHAFDWTRLAGGGAAEYGCGEGAVLILAGGLNADNVGRAVHEVGPYALDVSSGVESAKGIKDARAMRAFMAAVQRADSARRATNTNITGNGRMNQENTLRRWHPGRERAISASTAAASSPRR